MTKLEIAFQSVKVLIGVFIAVVIFGFVHPATAPTKLGQVYGVSAFNDLTDATLATTTLATYPGILHTILVTTPVANSVITVYDSANNAVIPATLATGTVTFGSTTTATSTATGTYAILVNGLTITSASVNNGSTTVDAAAALTAAINASSTVLNGITATSTTTNVVTLTSAFKGLNFSLSLANALQNGITLATAYTASKGSPVVATITIPASAPAPFELTFDNIFVNGLTVVQATATSTLTAEYQQN